MNTERILSYLNKIPLLLFVVAYLGWVGYDYYYDFRSSPDSPLNQRKSQLESTNHEVDVLRDKIKRAQDFYKTLDQKRSEIRGLSLQLDQLKATLSEELDFPSFMRLVTTEAEKVGVDVTKISPAETSKSEYVVEQVYELTFHSVYIQLLVFLQRLSNLERIIRVESLSFKPAVDVTNAGYIPLDGVLKLKTYRYLGTKADDLGNANAAALNASQGGKPPIPGPSPAPAAVNPAGGAK